MIIKKLVLHNFGVYAATNILEFGGNKPIVLIGGMNGRGKTTILEAVLLSLYGSNSFAYTESKYATYGQYLRSYVNKTDGTLKTYIEIEFSMDSANKEVYFVHREWDANGQKIREKIWVKKNGIKSEFLTQNWSMFVENILPSALSSFFFFDGEKIAELAVEDTSEQMKESIKAMLGITVLDVLQGDLGKIIKKINKHVSNKQDLIKLEELRSVKEDISMALLDINEKINIEYNALDNRNLELEKLHTQYSIKGGKIIEYKNDLLIQKAKSMASMSNCQEQLLELVAGEMPLALVRPLLLDIQEQGIIEQEQRINKLAFDRIRQLFNEFSTRSDEVNSFMNFVQSEIDINHDETIYNLSDMVLYQVDVLNQESMDKCSEQVIQLMKERTLQKNKIDEIDNSLSLDIEENDLNKLQNKIKSKEKEIIETETRLNKLDEEKASLYRSLSLAEWEFDKYAEEVIANLEAADSEERTIKYVHIAIEIIKLYRVRLQEKKIANLADTMTVCYKKLANKKNLVNKIEINSETLDLHYLNNEGEEITKKRLSAGEKQLMVISLLWALAICSKKKLPVIIDTPLSRLDSSHRQALIKTYFPNASDQTIILSTDSEINEDYYKLMKKNIGDEYTLQYSDRTKKTTVKPGYFGWGGTQNDN